MIRFTISIGFILTTMLIFSQQRWEVTINDSTSDFEFITSSNSYDNGIYIYSRTDWTENTIFKRNVNGEELWAKQIFFDNIQAPYGIAQNQDGHLLLFGISNDNATLVMLDECGNLNWCNKLINSNYLSSGYIDAIFTEDGNIIALITLEGQDNNYDIGLLSFDIEGNLLWFNPFDLSNKYELLDFHTPFNLGQFNNFLIITGYCYYAYPDNPSLVWLKPMIIKTDSLFNEEWLLPYGMPDSIIGFAFDVLPYNGTGFQSYGSYYKHNTDTINSLLMNLDQNGVETGYIGIENHILGSDIAENSLLQVLKRNDTSNIAMFQYGSDIWNLPKGELILDSLGSIYQHQNHPNTNFGFYTLQESNDAKFHVAYRYNNSDIILYKFNSDLTSAPIDTTTYQYDYLCDDLPIASDTIYIENCSIITDIGEIPTQRNIIHP